MDNTTMKIDSKAPSKETPPPATKGGMKVKSSRSGGQLTWGD